MGRIRTIPAYAYAILALSVVYPLAAFVASNNYQLLAIFPLCWLGLFVWCSAVAVLALLTIRFEEADPRRLAIVIAIVVVSFFSYSAWLNAYAEDLTSRVLQVAIWLLLTALVAKLAYEVCRHDSVRFFVMVFAAMMTALPVARVAIYRATIGSEPVTVAAQSVEPLVHGSPNVYWFVLDEYARADQIQHFTGFDSSQFYDDLRSRGFAVSDSSRASYTRTQQSISSTLFMEYLFAPDTDLSNENAVAAQVFAGDNPTVARFAEHGYSFVYADAGHAPWGHCTGPPADRCVDYSPSFRELDEFGVQLVKSTPLAALEFFDFNRPEVADATDQVLADLDELSPFFLFAHVMSPHWPFRYETDCSPRPKAVDAVGGTVENRMALYANEVRCLNEQLLAAVDRILAADPEAIIILQGDHGSSFSVDFLADNDEWTSSALNERLAPLNAMRLPPRCGDDERYDIEGQPLVNTFRLVFACLEGREPDLLEYEAYLSSWETIDDLERIDESRFADDGP